MSQRRPLRRNDIVLHETVKAWSIPGRVVRRVDGETVEIINTLGRIAVVAEQDLDLQTAGAVEKYDDDSSPARRARPILRRMPSLRRLKQAAAWYDPNVWKRGPRPSAAPAGPDYSDEITTERLAAIQRLVDASRPAGQVLTPIGEPGW